PDTVKIAGSIYTTGDLDSIRLAFDLPGGGSGRARVLRTHESSPFLLSDLWMSGIELGCLEGAVSGIVPITPAGRGDVNAHISGYQDRKILASGNIRSSAGDMSGKVMLDGTGKLSGLAYLSFKDLNLEKWLGQRIPGWKITGHASGDNLLSLGDIIKGESDISISAGSIFGISVKGVNSSWRSSGSEIGFAPAYMNFPAGILKTGGKIDLKKKNLALDFKGTGLDVFSALKKLDLSGLGINISSFTAGLERNTINASMDITGNINGPWASPFIKGEGTLSGGVWQGESLAGVFGFTRNFEGRIKFENVNLTSGETGYLLEGYVDPASDLSMDLHISVDDGNLAKIGQLLPAGKYLKPAGKLNGNMHIKGTPESPVISGKATITSGNIFGQPFEELMVSFSSHKSDLFINEIYGRIYHGEIKGNGEISQDGEFSFELTANSFPLEELKFFDQFFGQVSGEGNLYFQVSGTRQNPMVYMDFLIDNFSLRDYMFDTARGTFNWENKTLKIKDLLLTHSAKTTSMSGSITFPGNKLPERWQEWKKCDFSLKGKSEGVDVSTMLGLLNHPLRDRLTGLAMGEFEMHGNLPLPTGHLDITIDDGKIGNVPLEDAVLNVTYGDEGLKGEGEIKTGTGSINVSINMDEKMEGVLDLVADTFDLSIISGIFAIPYPIRGDLNLMAHVTRSLSKPGGYCTFKVDNGAVGKFPYDSFSGYLELEDNVVKIKNVVLKRGKHKATMEGIVPLTFMFKDKDADKEMQVNIKYAQDDLSILSFFIPGYESSEGRVSVDGSITGSFSDTTLSGEVSVKNGKLKIAALDNPIENIMVTAVFSGDRLLIKDLRGTVGGGRFGVRKGSWAKFSGIMPIEYNVDLFGSGLVLDSPKYFVGRLDAELHLDTYPGGGHVLCGKVIPKDATINIPVGEVARKGGKKEEVSLTPSWLDNYEANLMLDLKDQIWLKFSGSNLLTEGHLQLIKEKGNLDLVGKVDIVKGNLTLPFLESSLKVMGGSANFYLGGGLYPYLEDVSAETDISGVRIYAIFNGNLGEKNPNAYHLDLTSNPPRTKDQIMALLLTGIDAPSMSSEQVGTMFENRAMQSVIGVAEGMVLNPIASALGKSLTLTDMSVNMSAMGGWSMRMAKGIGTGERLRVVYVTYHLPSGDIRNLWGLEYALPYNMLMRLLQDNMGQYYYWIQALRRYN
ncbi:MAG: translocation/assembly module TamB domain-containing protein, partial [Candidatus Eremiobacteraeota bacterium]|nr:translocation/assembly module TamB domain-containing protein [Candidatus Eremiobacteraeota bacterium]